MSKKTTGKSRPHTPSALRTRLFHKAGTVLTLSALVVGLAVGQPVRPAAAAENPATPPPETVSTDVLTTPQINGVVWDLAVNGNVAYAVGSFTRARPSGATEGSSAEVVRNNAMSFDISTGALLPWNPNLNAQARAVDVSPDGSEVFVGGEFSAVGGQARSKLAVFNTGTGALKPFSTSIGGSVHSISITAGTVYVGGSFKTAGGQNRSNAAAFNRSSGAILPWAPAADNIVHAVLASADNSRVVLGGRFQTLNGQPLVGIGAVDGSTGATQRWTSTPIPARQGENSSWVTQLVESNGVVYGSANGDGWHWFDGRFAADFASGDLVWLDNCYGSSTDVAVMGEAMYSVSHAHDCTSLGEFPESNPQSWHRGLAETTYATGTDKGGPSGNSKYSGQPVPSLLHWYPTINTGFYTNQFQGGWALAASGNYLVMGGEFTTINGKNQQGLAVFAKRSAAPNKIGPVYSAGLKPTAVSRDPGSVRIAWPSTWDYDDATLTYDVLRDNSLTAVASIDQKSTWWQTAGLGYEDTGQAPGSSHTYRIRVRDPWGNEYIGPRSDPVTVSAASTADPYSSRVVSDGAQSYYRLDENGPVALDRAGFSDADKGAGISRTDTSAVEGNAAAAFDGSGTASVATRNFVPAPNTFSLEAWFQTTSTTGGYIAGFGDARTGNSSSHDRHIWMDNSGRVWFGTWLGNAATVNSAKTYNDGKWHHVTVTLGPAGTVLYVDGVRVSSRTDVTSGQAYNGYWRIGGDNLSGWPSAPTSNAFKGNLDEVAVYPTALSSSTVMDHYKLSGRTAAIPPAPTDGYGKAVYQDEPAAYWQLEESSGDVATDTGQSGNDGLVSGAVTKGAEGVAGGKSFNFGGSDGVVAATAPTTNPTIYSVEAWFKTSTTRGGKIIGFGNRNTGSSNNYDRHVYMLNDGRLVFGTYTGTENLVTTGGAYNNDAWHHVVATQSAEGMRLYVDGQLQGTNPQAGAQNYTGYWRVGGDSTWGGAASGYFAGSIDEAAIYASALSEARVRAHYAAGGGTVEEPVTAAFTSSASGRTASFDASGSTPDAEYAWDFGDGAKGTGLVARHTYTQDGTFTVKLTVTAGGRTAVQSAEVSVGATAPTAVFSVESTELTARFDASGSSDAEGPLVSYDWDFGDGTSGTGVTAEHTYASAGTYQAVLTVVDQEGATASTQQDVQVAAAAPAAYAVDTFSRSSTSGWGAAEQGGNYNHPGSKANFTMENGIGRIRMSAAGSGPSVYLDAGTYTDTEMQVELGNDKPATGGGIYHHLYLRDVPGAGAYTAKVRYLANGTVNVSLNRDASFIVPEKAVPGLTYQMGDKLSVRAQATGTGPTTLRIKVWKSGTAEPNGWQLSATDSTAALQVPGRTGVGAYLSGSATNAPVFSLWDNLWIGVPKP